MQKLYNKINKKSTVFQKSGGIVGFVYLDILPWAAAAVLVSENAVFVGVNIEKACLALCQHPISVNILGRGRINAVVLDKISAVKLSAAEIGYFILAVKLNITACVGALNNINSVFSL